MAKELGFRNFFHEHDIFGFDKEKAEREKQEFDDKIVSLSDLPVRKFDLGRMMDFILRESQYDPKPAHSRFLTEVQWGSQPGAMRLVITPKYHAVVQRLHTDLEGEPAWLCKKVFSINAPKYAGKEDIVASELHEVVQLVERQGMENPHKKPDLEDLANDMANRFKREPNEFLYLMGMKQVTENHYCIYFSGRAGGVGRSTGAKTSAMIREYIINVGYEKNRGLIKVFSHFVNETDEGESWGIQPAEFNQLYMPSQPNHEIIESIVTSLRYF